MALTLPGLRHSFTTSYYHTLLRGKNVARRVYRYLGTTNTHPMVMTGMMKAVVGDGKGGIAVVERPIPKPKDGELLLKVAAVGVNRADVMQVKGSYPPPPGTTDILGLEASGYLNNGEPATALLTGGAFAEYVAIPKESILHFPKPVFDRFTFTELAGIPEAFLAAYHTMFQMGRLSQNETVLINAAASGVGTSAIQLASTIPNVTIIACSSNIQKLEHCLASGAHHTINYNTESISKVVSDVSKGVGVHVLLDCVGARQFKENARSLRQDGRWIMYGLLSGARSPDISLAGIIIKRLTIMGTTMRSRPAEYRAAMIRSFIERFGDQFCTGGALHPVIHKEFQGLEAAGEAFKLLESNQSLGKLIVRPR